MFGTKNFLKIDLSFSTMVFLKIFANQKNDCKRRVKTA